MKKIAVILSGCGFKDGSEIHESVLTLLAIDKNNAQYQCFAPDINNIEVINHITNQKTGEKRNVLIESARIARGEIKPLNEFDAEKLTPLYSPAVSEQPPIYLHLQLKARIVQLIIKYQTL
jgi:enhancing lycopene biosynthesis protein 2